jgi:hypothetical protein
MVCNQDLKMQQLRPRLRAGIRLYRHQQTALLSGVVHYGGKYATALDRQYLAGLVQVANDGQGAYNCKMHLPGGVTLLWDIPDDGVDRKLTFDGKLPLRVTSFDRHHLLLADTVLKDGAPGTYPLPQAVAQVALTALEPSADDAADGQKRTIGWQADSLFIQVNPVAFLGEDVVVRPLSPTRIRRGRNLLDCGLVDARAVIARNWVMAGQRQRGWIKTYFPASIRSVGIAVRQEHEALQTGFTLEGAVNVAFSPSLQDGSHLQIENQSLTAPKVSRDENTSSRGRLWYELPPSPRAEQPYSLIWTQPQPGWLLDSVVALNDAVENLQGMSPQLSPERRAVLSTAVPSVVTDVELQA